MQNTIKEPKANFSFSGSKRKLILALLIFLLITTTSVALDGYFLWLHITGETITISWAKKTVFSTPLPYKDLKVSLWIPLASMTILLGYLTIIGRTLNLRISIWRRRFHHYHVGILSIGLSTFFIVPLFLPAFQDLPIKIILKGAMLSETLEGLSFIFLTSGASLIFSDARDLLSSVRRLRLREKERSGTT